MRVSKIRVWLETGTAVFAGLLGILTVFWHDWIETVFGVDPDHGNGSAEWLVVLALAVVTVALAVGARHEWRRAHRVMRTA